MTRIDLITYTLRHKMAFLKVEKEMLGRNTFRGLIHDVDKLLLYLFPGLTKDDVQRIHRKINSHHDRTTRNKAALLEMIIDWQCGPLTKPDKPLNAYDTMLKFYPHMKNRILPLLERFLPSQVRSLERV